MSVAHSRVYEATSAVIRLLNAHKQPGEAIVRQAIVLRLLQAAGFDIWNPDEVTPEETNVGGKRPDFLIRVGQLAFILELKGMNVQLGNAESQQAVSYAGSVGVRWAILTNGRVWIVLDESLSTTPYHEREVLRLELTLSDPEPFAGDFEKLLGAPVWRENRFEQAVLETQERQLERQERQRVLQEKRPEVEAFQREYEIGSFAKAAELYTLQGNMSQAEKEVLLRVESETESKKVPLDLLFWLNARGIKACARYEVKDGSWLVLAGSQAATTVVPSVKYDLKKRRDQLIEAGILRPEGGSLVLQSDMKFTSPSGAAVFITGASQNGWTIWRDERGQPAQLYRLDKS